MQEQRTNARLCCVAEGSNNSFTINLQVPNSYGCVGPVLEKETQAFYATQLC